MMIVNFVILTCALSRRFVHVLCVFILLVLLSNVLWCKMCWWRWRSRGLGSQVGEMKKPTTRTKRRKMQNSSIFKHTDKAGQKLAVENTPNWPDFTNPTSNESEAYWCCSPIGIFLMTRFWILFVLPEQTDYLLKMLVSEITFWRPNVVVLPVRIAVPDQDLRIQFLLILLLCAFFFFFLAMRVAAGLMQGKKNVVQNWRTTQEQTKTKLLWVCEIQRASFVPLCVCFKMNLASQNNFNVNIVRTPLVVCHVISVRLCVLNVDWNTAARGCWSEEIINSSMVRKNSWSEKFCSCEL